MKSILEIRSALDRLSSVLPESIKRDLILDYSLHNTLHGIIDVVIKRGNQCMAIGRFCPVSEKNSNGFSLRFNIAMGYPNATWYLFDYDGERMLINDLSREEPLDEYPESIESGFRRLCTLPAEWRAEQSTLEDMKRYLEAVRYLIDEQALENNVK